MNTAQSPHIDSNALDLPNGARFFRCALQVNPYDYLIRYNKTTEFKTEDDYNSKIIEECLLAVIEVIAVTDHYRVNTLGTSSMLPVNQVYMLFVDLRP